MNRCKTFTALLLAAVLLTGCMASAPAAPGTEQPVQEAAQPDSAQENITEILLSETDITVNGTAAGSDSTAGVFLSNDIIFYEDLETYPSGHAYGEGTAEERHTAAEAAANRVVNITAPGTYRLQGTLPLGQVRVDLGEEASSDPAAVVTLILDGVDITCDVAPAILFLNVYECDGGWSTETAGAEVDTAAAGANVIIADGSTNHVSGSHVARIYKDGGEEKKLWKQDGAVYSYMSMNVDGEEAGSGVLNITADNEGLDTELHLTVNGGNLNIRSNDDGINTNEDGVSVTTINGGNIHIIAGLGAEGDGIDSNGWLVINGGTVVAAANPAADAGMDSDMGSYINGGTVVALGSTMDWAESDSRQVTMNLQFAQYEASDTAIVITDKENKVVFAYDPAEDEVMGEDIRQFMGAVISCPALQQGESYQVYMGGSLTGTELAGIYEAAAVTGYEGGLQQQYTGTDVRRGFGGMMGGGPAGEGRFGDMTPPEDFEGGGMHRGGVGGGGRFGAPEGSDGTTPPELPEGFEEGMTPPEPPEGFEEGMVPPEPPEGFEEGMVPPQMPGEDTANDGTITQVEPCLVFYMQDKVNNFSGVTAAA